MLYGRNEYMKAINATEREQNENELPAAYDGFYSKINKMSPTGHHHKQ